MVVLEILAIEQPVCPEASIDQNLAVNRRAIPLQIQKGQTQRLCWVNVEELVDQLAQLHFRHLQKTTPCSHWNIRVEVSLPLSHLGHLHLPENSLQSLVNGVSSRTPGLYLAGTDHGKALSSAVGRCVLSHIRNRVILGGGIVSGSSNSSLFVQPFQTICKPMNT